MTLRQREHELAPDDAHFALDADNSPQEVNVVQADPEQLALPQPAAGGQEDHLEQSSRHLRRDRVDTLQIPGNDLRPLDPWPAN
nr:hypothetical protein [Actinopolymorpha alba]